MPLRDTYRVAATTAGLRVAGGAGEADDFRLLTRLARRFGSQRLARVCGRIDEVAGPDPRLPLATALCRELARTGRIERRLVEAGDSTRVARATAAGCGRTALRIVVDDLRPGRVADLPRDVAGLRALVDDRGLPEWRRALAPVALNPWGPEVGLLGSLARAADLTAAVAAVEWCTQVFRARFEEAERREVAREICRLIELSGCSQRDFAHHVGTSASRMSTYANGLVTPSAAMMLRFGRSARALSQGAWAGGLHT